MKTIYAQLVALYLLHLLARGVMALGYFQSSKTEYRVISALRALIFETAIAVPNQQCEDKKRIAEVTRMYEQETFVIGAAFGHVQMLWGRVALLALEVYILVRMFHSNTLVLLAIFAILGLTSLLGEFLVRHAREKYRVKSTVRLNFVHECFKGILMVKLNAWERKIRARMERARDEENRPRKTFAFLHASSLAFDDNTTHLFSALFLAVMAREQSLFSAAQIFTALILVDRIKNRIHSLIWLGGCLIGGAVSLRSIDQYISDNQTEMQYAAKIDPKTSHDADVVIAIERACFTDPSSGKNSQVLLANANLTIRRRQLVIIRGKTGTSKSTLLRAILNEVRPLYGNVSVKIEEEEGSCRVAYCPQEPWLQTLSVRGNILFGSAYDEHKYWCVLDACCLLDDLKMLPGGDATRVGPKGVNLSGGQKSRIALARACYADADLYMLDCPFASVDAIVQSDVFRKCIVDLLRYKTVVLVTHNPEMISNEFVDQVVSISDSCANVVDCHGPRDSKRRSRWVRGFESAPPWKRTPDASEAHNLVRRGLSLWKIPNDTIPSVTKAAVSRFYDKTEPEQSEVSDLSLKLLLPVFLQLNFCVPVGLSFAAIVICGFVSSAKDLWLVSWISGNGSTSPGMNATIYGGLVAVALVPSVFGGVMVSLGFFNVSNRLLGSITWSLLTAPMTFFYSTPVREILKRYFHDLEMVEGYLSKSIWHLVHHATTLFFQVAIVWYFMGFTGIFAALIVIFALRYMFPTRDSFRLEGTGLNESRRLNFISESLDGASSIRAFGPSQVERFRFVHGLWSDAATQRDYFGECFNTFVVIRSTHIYGMLLSLLRLLLWRNQFSSPELGLMLHYIFMIEDNIMGVATGVINSILSLSRVQRVCEYCSIEPESKVHTFQIIRPPSGWPQVAQIVFDKVNFGYSAEPNGDTALRNLTFTVTGGQKVGVVGRAGSGKSSLAMALFRLHPLARGCIQVDGVDISRLDLDVLRSSICIIPQTPMFYRCTVRHYLDPFDESNDGDLWSAIHKCGLQTSVSSLEAELLDNGENWSLGERQMLCMARALLKPLRLLVLDESFSALDQASETRLLAVLDDSFARSTVFLITHRLDQVLKFDKIMVLEKGKLLEFGSAAELASDPGSAFYEFLETTLLTF